jgi:aspartate aminotransferase
MVTGTRRNRALFSDQNAMLGTENAFKILPHIHNIEQKGKEVIRLNLGEPDFNIPLAVEKEIIRQLHAHNTHYCDPKGILSLREAIAKSMGEMRGLKISPDCVVVFPGGKPSIGFSLQVYCNPGDEVIYPSPGFPIYESFTTYIGAIPKPLHLKEEHNFSFTPEELDALITDKTKLIILNFPSNPTGGIATADEIKAIAEVIMRRCGPEVRVYSDEIYEYIVFDGKKHVSIASVPGMQQRTIITSGMSKTFAWTGGRVGYAVFPTVEEAEAFKNLNINYFSCVPPYNQEGAREALENPAVQKNVNEMVATFEKRRNWIYKALNEIDGISAQNPKGAFYIFPNIAGVCKKLGIIDVFESLPATVKSQTSPSTLFQMFALYEHQVAVLDRASFGKYGVTNEHYLRLSYAADMDQLEQGVARLAEASQNEAGFKKFMKTYHA